MQELIEKIAEIDEVTVGIARSAEEEKKRIEREMRDRTAKYDAELSRDTEEKILKIKEELSAKAKEELSAHEKACEAEIHRIERLYEERHGELSEEIVKRITGEARA